VKLGRPIQSLRALSDHMLWAAYRIAHCTVFPSLNEGFGLPVAESLAAGTPVITSNFGSMQDIVLVDGEPLGGLLVDPRDDDSVTEALRTMLTDGEVYERLKDETGRRPVRTWDDYASELWTYLVEGHRSE
jgi:glycosyltransferase involved in cell wall biosynthesis